MRSIVASYLGRIAESDTRVLTLAILKGILGRTVHEPVSFVNAPMLARERGLTVSEMRSTVSQDYVSSISLRAETDEGPGQRGGLDPGEGPRARDAGERLRHRGDAGRAHGVLHLRRTGPGIIGTVGHDARRARREHRDDGRRPQGRGRRGADVPHGRHRGARSTCSTHVASEIDAHQLRAVTLPT